MIVLDTTVIVDVMRGRPAALGLMRDQVHKHQPACVPAPVVQELFFGAGRTGPDERDRIEQVLAGCRVVALDGDIAKAAGLLEARLEKAGKKHGRVDVQIAACAMAVGGSLVTRDHRIDIEGLDVITY